MTRADLSFQEATNPFASSGADLAAEVIRVLRRYSRSILGCALVGSAIALFFFTLSKPSVFQARTSVQVQEINENFLNMKSADPTTPLPDYSAESNIETQIKLLQSKSLLLRVIARLKSQAIEKSAPSKVAPKTWIESVQSRFRSAPTRDEAIAYAAGHVAVRVLETSHVVEIVCDSTDASVAADFANSLVTEFIDSRLEARWKGSRHTSEWLLHQLGEVKNQLQKSENALQAYARSNNLLFTNEKSNVAEEGRQQAQIELAKARGERIQKQSRYEQLSSAQTIQSVIELMDEAAPAEDRTDDYKTKLSDLKHQIAILGMNPSLGEVGRIQAQVDAVERALRMTPAAVLSRAKADYQAALRREALLQADYDAQSQYLSTQSDKNVEYSLLKRDVDSNRLIYEAMLQKVKETSVTAAMQISNMSVVDPAEPADKPYKPQVLRNCFMGLFAGLVCGVGLAFVRERSDRTVKAPNETATFLNLPELGVLPAVHLAPGEVQLAMRTERSSIFAEAVRATLTSILFAFHGFQSGLRPFILVLTSSAPAEGKTTVLCNLGIAIAETRRRVLLIDADFRKPRLHDVFDVPNVRGLNDILNSEEPITLSMLEEIAQRSDVANVSVLTTGLRTGSISDLLYSVRLNELFDVARQRYDAVLIDTPPMVQISDARILAQFTDGVIFVVRSERTSRDAAIQATSRLQEDGTPVIGTILNDWDPKGAVESAYRESSTQDFAG